MTLPPSPLPSQLPLLELGWERFEKFCCELVGRLPGVEHSHLEGARGDAQRGVDIVATLTEGTTWAFQCKCTKTFTTALFRQAVAAASLKTDRYVLLLAMQATSAVREEARQHARWEVWDTNDIAQRVRMLPGESARTLVGTHFGPQWQHLFLGRSGPAAFVSMDEFLLLDRAHLFHHAWATIGRADTLRALREFATAGGPRIAILAGRGGIGKSKVLHAFAQAAVGTEAWVRFAVPGVPITSEALDGLEPGPGLVVVDDAHQRDDLAALFAAARRPHAPLQLVLSIRPYARDGIHAALSRAGFDMSELLELPQLREFTRGETASLASEVLGAEYAHLVDVLAAYGGDSPLVIVLAGQLIRREQLDPRLLSQRDEFRRIVLNAFRDALLGEVGDRANARICRNVLKLASAIGPFRPEFPGFQDAAGTFLGTRADEVRDALRALEDAGVLLRRGRMLRITPDVLANHVLEEACINSDGTSTGYAERLHGTFRDAARSALLRNLAELDWRRSRGGAASGGEQLLHGIWNEIEAEFRRADVARRAEIIHGLGMVAYFQPGPALRLVRMAQPSPAFWAGPGKAQDLARVVPPVLGTIAYNPDYTEDCCELLWRLGRDQPQNALDPHHPLSVLHELAAYRRHKAIELQHAVVTAVQRWVAEPDAHQHLLSPLDVLTPVLAKTALSPGFGPLFVLPEPTAPLRERALAIVAAVARGEDVRAARHAVQRLGYVLDAPIPAGGYALPDGIEALWRPYRAQALAVLADVSAAPAHPLVHLACLDRLSRHIRRGSGDPLADAVRAAFASVERSFELRFAEILLRVNIPAVYDVPPWTDLPSGSGDREPQEAGQRETAAEFLTRHPDPADGVARIASRIETIEALGVDLTPADASCRVLARELAHLDADYTAALCEHAVLGPPSPLRSHLAPWLWWVRQTRPDRYLRLAGQILDTCGVLECAALAATLWDPEGPPLDGAGDILAQTLAHPDSRVHWEALPALWLLARTDPDRATELALTVGLGHSAEVADRFAETFVAWHPGGETLPAPIWDALLDKLVPVEHLDIASVYQLLDLASRGSPRGVVRMLRTRISRAAGETSRYRPLPSVRPEALNGFLAAPDHEQMLREIRDAFLQLPRTEAAWMPELYSLASAGYGDAGIRVLREWIDGAGAQSVIAAGSLLRVVSPDFLVGTADIIQILLARADAVGPEVLDTVQATLYEVVGKVAAEAGRAGMMASVWPPLLELQETGQALAADPALSRIAREFYRELARLAKECIQNAVDSEEEQFYHQR
jgi:hypothetical protein